MENPNEYDDAAFVEASNDFQGWATEGLDKFWAAGAGVTDIESEIANAVENSELNEEGKTVRVQITIE